MVVEHAHGLRQRRGPNAKSSLHKAHLAPDAGLQRSEEHTSELQSLMRISYAVFCLKKKKKAKQKQSNNTRKRTKIGKQNRQKTEQHKKYTNDCITREKENN